MSNNHHRHRLNSLKPPQVVVVMVPFPAQGHLNQLLQLSRLISSYDIPVHFIGTTTHNRQAKLRATATATANIHFHDFAIPPFLSPPPNPNAATKFPMHLKPAFDASSHLRSPTTTLLRSLSPNVDKIIVIHDTLMASVIQDVPLIPNAESYVFRSISAFATFLNLWEAAGKPSDIARNIETLIPKKIPSMEGCFTQEFINFINDQFSQIKINSGCLYNTCRVLEAPYIDLVAKVPVGGSSKLWAIGPLNPVETYEERNPNYRRHKCIDWLDKQAPNSVIFVSFGTTISFSKDQIDELAIGLEKSMQKFIWVLKEADRGDVFIDRGELKLPNGYEERVEGNGMGVIVRDWAPQLEVLGHPSTGGFMSHCGWNSCMESVTMGVPIAAWPMHSDQPRNTVLVTDVLGVGIVVKEWEKHEEIVKSSTIERAVKRLLASDEGDVMRKRVEELGGIVRRSTVEGGMSRVEFDSFIAHIKR